MREAKPVPGAKVEVLQTKHAFLFGCNIFLWGKVGTPEDERLYRRPVSGRVQLCHYSVLLAGV